MHVPRRTLHVPRRTLQVPTSDKKDVGTAGQGRHYLKVQSSASDARRSGPL